MNLKDLATALGLSPTTVSRALNGYPEVNDATRLRVSEAALRLNYRPNQKATSLATGRAMAVGHFLPISSSHEMVNPIFADFLAGAAESYAAAGYDIVLKVVKDSDQERVYRDLKARATVDGVILHAPVVDDPRIALLTELGLPFVLHGRSTGSKLPYSWVDVNNEGAFFRATRHLTDLGHRRIALVNGLHGMDFAIRRRTGYLQGLGAARIAVDPELEHAQIMSEGAGYRAAQSLLSLHPPATAFLAASMLQAMGIRRAVEDCGLKLARDVSVVAFDDDLSYLRNGDDVPVFTATRSSVRQAGQLAADLLLGLIKAPGLPHRSRLLEAELVVGQSCGPVKA